MYELADNINFLGHCILIGSTLIAAAIAYASGRGK